MTLSEFIKVVCGGPEPEFWEDIFEEYLKLSGSSSNNIVLGLLKDIAIYTFKADIIEELCSVALLQHNEKLNALLRKTSGMPGKGILTEAEIRKHLNVVITFRHKAKDKRLQLEQIQGKVEKMTKKNWTDLLAVMSKFQGYRIDPDIISVEEFCSLYTLFSNRPQTTR